MSMTPATIGQGESPGPATPARRLELAKTMLVWAIRGYEVANHQWSVVRESYPELPAPDPDGDPEGHRGWMNEYREWMRLFDEADDAFNSAELGLAQRIENLYDRLAPEGRKSADQDSPYFVPRAVRHNGMLYVLIYSPNNHEPGTHIIGVYSDSMALDLAGD